MKSQTETSPVDKMTQKSIYLDVCSLSRPFDDQDYIMRIRLETEAVNLILSRARKGAYRLPVSAVHIREIDAIPDAIERIELQVFLDRLDEPIKLDMAKTRVRAEDLVNLGFGVADAAHVAFAEQAGVGHHS